VVDKTTLLSYIGKTNTNMMNEQQLAEHLDDVIAIQMHDVLCRIKTLSTKKKEQMYVVALYKEYQELLDDNKDIDILTINKESGEINEYLVEKEFE
jgi:hypothetical protein